MLTLAVPRAAALSVLLAITAAAQNAPAEKHVLDPFLPSWLSFGGQVRGRLEVPAGSDLVTDSGNPFVLTRLRMNVTVKPLPWLSFFAEGQDTRGLNYDGAVPTNMQDPVDLRDAYMELKSGVDTGMMVRVGRQDMAIGSTRLISIGPWSNTSKSYDVIRTAWFRPAMRLELIAGSPVLLDGTRFDRHKPGEHFYVSYNSFRKIVPGSLVEPYFIAKTVVGVTGETGSHGDAAVYTSGLRWTGVFAKRFDYSAEFVRQWGSWASDHIRASAGTYTFGWTFDDSPRKARISADFSHATGDRNPTDGTRGAMDFLYGSNQPFFSYTGMFAWRNLRTWRAGVNFNARKNVKVVLDYRDFYLATVADSWYNSSGNRIVLNRKASSRHIGEGPDMQLQWTAGPFGQVTIGVAEVFAGAYLHESAKSSGYLYPYLSWGRQF